MIQRWDGEPPPGARCTCAHRIVATLEETLICPAGFRYLPGVGFVHALWIYR